MTEVQEKFIDLGVEGNGSAYGDMAAKQEKFSKDLNKMPFKFQTKMFDLPPGDAKNDAEPLTSVPADLIDLMNN